MQCGYTVLTAPAAPSGVTYYWQTTADGEEVTNSSASYTAHSNTTVHLRAGRNSSGCWSPATSHTIFVNQNPGAAPGSGRSIFVSKGVLKPNTSAAGDNVLFGRRVRWIWQGNARGRSKTIAGHERCCTGPMSMTNSAVSSGNIYPTTVRLLLYKLFDHDAFIRSHHEHVQSGLNVRDIYFASLSYNFLFYHTVYSRNCQGKNLCISG